MKNLELSDSAYKMLLSILEVENKNIKKWNPNVQPWTPKDFVECWILEYKAGIDSVFGKE